MFSNSLFSADGRGTERACRRPQPRKAPALALNELDLHAHQVASSNDALAEVVSEVLSEVAAWQHSTLAQSTCTSKAVPCMGTQPQAQLPDQGTTAALASNRGMRWMPVCLSNSLVDGQLHSKAVAIGEQQDPSAVVPVGRKDT